MKKLSFWLLLGSILVFSRCQKESLGLDLIPPEDKIKVGITDTVTIKLTTERYSHINTYGKNYVLLGSYVDPIFGTTKASFATQILQVKYPKHSEGVVVDSVKLDIKLSQNFIPYGDVYKEIPVKVYQLSDTITPKKYYSDDDPALYTDFELLGEDLYKPYANGNDTSFIIKLNTDFVQQWFDNQDQYFYSEAQFTDIFYGLYVTVDQNADDDLSLMKLDINNYKNYMYVYYHLSNYPDSNFVYTLSVLGSIAQHFTLIEHDYSNTDVFNPNIDSVVYLQSLAGTKIKFELPYIKQLQGKIVEKAELVLKLAPEQYTYQPSFPALDKIYFAKFYSNAPDLGFSVDDFYSPTSGYQGIELQQNEYRINLTRIVQQMIDGTDSIPDSTFNYYLYDLNSAENFNRSVINTFKNSNPSKLVIIFTEPSKI